jgi:DNA-binding response OmpR family regulator
MERPPATIVVLEENAAAQDLIEQSLRESGDRVLVSNNPMEALGLARRLRIDLIVGDAGLLEKTDPLVVKRLQGVGEMVYTHVRDSSVLDRASGPRLRSPFSLEELRDAVDAALGRESVSGRSP